MHISMYMCYSVVFYYAHEQFQNNTIYASANVCECLLVSWCAVLFYSIHLLNFIHMYIVNIYYNKQQQQQHHHQHFSK